MSEGAKRKPAFPPLRLNHEGLALFIQWYGLCVALVPVAEAGDDLAAEDAWQGFFPKSSAQQGILSLYSLPFFTVQFVQEAVFSFFFFSPTNNNTFSVSLCM